MYKIYLLLSMIRLAFQSFFSFGRIKIKYPVKINKGARITRIDSGIISLGKYTSMGFNARIGVAGDGVVEVGERSGINDNCVIVARNHITIGKNVMLGPNVCIYDHDHIYEKGKVTRELGFNTSPVIIEDNVWIGANVTILKGVTIGSGSIIAAGTVVTSDIPRDSVAYDKREKVIRAL